MNPQEETKLIIMNCMLEIGGRYQIDNVGNHMIMVELLEDGMVFSFLPLSLLPFLSSFLVGFKKTELKAFGQDKYYQTLIITPPVSL